MFIPNANSLRYSCHPNMTENFKHLPTPLQYSSSMSPSQSLSIWSPIDIVDTVFVHGCRIQK